MKHAHICQKTQVWAILLVFFQYCCWQLFWLISQPDVEPDAHCIAQFQIKSVHLDFADKNFRLPVGCVRRVRVFHLVVDAAAS
jgi:hypothetical protein